MMQKPTLLLLAALLLSGCASTPNNPELDEAARLKSDGYLHQAIADFRNGDMPKASEAAEKSIAFNPKNGLAYNLRGLARERLGQVDSASRDFQKAMELSPNDPTVRNNFGTLLCSRKQYTTAEQNFLYAAGIADNPEPEVAYTNAGLCAKRAGNSLKAREYFNEALSRNAGQPSALYQLANMELEAGNPVAANTYLTQYRRYAPHTAKTLYLGAKIEHTLGNIQGVEEYVSQLQSEFPNSTEIKSARLLIDQNSGQLSTAQTSANPAAAPGILSPESLKTTAPPAAQLEGEPPFVPTAATTTAATTTAATTAAVTSQLPPPAPAIPAFIPKTNIKVYGEDWVLAQPKHNYTLQLLASEDESKVDELIDSKVSPDDLAKISFTRYGNRWYNLVMGSYSSNSQAQAALDNLPAAMKKLNPWIRPISSLQRVIHAEAVTQQKKP